MMVSVDYDEGKPETYRGFVVTEGEEEIARFCSDPFIDFQDLLEWMDERKTYIWMMASSRDHFIEDYRKNLTERVFGG
jgi:hypothetical protein